MTRPSVVVVTPTCGSPELLDALNSVAAQTYPVHHLLVVDGPQYSTAFFDVIESFKPPPGHKFSDLYLPENTGRAFGNRYWGHRIYAGIANLVNEDVVMFLDDDNWLEPTHVAEQVANLVENKLSFSFSLRNIYTKAKEFLAQDNCESLGTYPVWTTKPGKERYHIDTSAYAFRREFLVEFGFWWHGGYAQDRKFLKLVQAFNARTEGRHTYQPTGGYTLNYRLGSTDMSAPQRYFERGNQLMHERYGGKYPWARDGRSADARHVEEGARPQSLVNLDPVEPSAGGS